MTIMIIISVKIIVYNTNKDNNNINSTNRQNDSISADDNTNIERVLISLQGFHFRFEFTPFEHQPKNRPEFRDVHFFPSSIHRLGNLFKFISQ